MSVGMGSGLDDLVRRQRAEIESLRSRLAEAERLLRSLRGHIPSETGWGQDQLDEVDVFLRTADSATGGDKP